MSFIFVSLSYNAFIFPFFLVFYCSLACYIYIIGLSAPLQSVLIAHRTVSPTLYTLVPTLLLLSVDACRLLSFWQITKPPLFIVNFRNNKMTEPSLMRRNSHNHFRSRYPHFMQLIKVIHPPLLACLTQSLKSNVAPVFINVYQKPQL